MQRLEDEFCPKPLGRRLLVILLVRGYGSRTDADLQPFHHPRVSRLCTVY